MVPVTLESLVCCGEWTCHFGGGHRGLRRTVELHTDHVLYCFEEPPGTMAKHMKEKLHLAGCQVVDCGTWGRRACLALFLHRHDYAERLNEQGNVVETIFEESGARRRHGKIKGALKGWLQSRRPWGWGSDTSFVEGPPSSPPRAPHYFVLLTTSDKMAKWRLLKALHCAVQSHSDLSLAQMSTAPSASFGRAGVSNRFDEVLNGWGGSDPLACSDKRDLLVAEGKPQETNENKLAESLSVQGAASGDTLSTAIAGEASRANATAEGNALLPEAMKGSQTADSSLNKSLGPRLEYLQGSPLYARCIVGRDDNQRCADCGDDCPTWCVLAPFGVFVCIRCVGVHRKLWASKCRGVVLDNWTTEEVDFMATRGNALVNTELEYCVAYPAGSTAALLGTPAEKPAGHFSSAELRENYIQSKYEERLFTAEKHPDVQGPVPIQWDLSVPKSTGEQRKDTPVPYSLPIQFENALTANDVDGPPNYVALLDVIVKELVGAKTLMGAVLVLTNGFQELRTRPGRRLLHSPSATMWDESLQLGVASVEAPLYCAVYSSSDELLAAAAFHLPPVMTEREEAFMFSVELPWCGLNEEVSHRQCGVGPWQVCLLASLRVLSGQS